MIYLISYSIKGGICQERRVSIIDREAGFFELLGHLRTLREIAVAQVACIDEDLAAVEKIVEDKNKGYKGEVPDREC